jgi:hypothetical protein
MPQAFFGAVALVVSGVSFMAPSPAELAEALGEFTGKPVSASDVRGLSCEGIEEEPTEAVCKWDQMKSGEWMQFSTYVAVDGRGWHLIDTPSDLVDVFVQQKLQISDYKRADMDLNGDGRPETFVYVTDRNYCGSGGCKLVVLSPRKGNYHVVLRSTVTQLPISVLPTSSRGWRDVGVTVAGGGITRPYMARLRFNGSRYPGNPTVAPAVPLSRPAGKVLIGG